MRANVWIIAALFFPCSAAIIALNGAWGASHSAVALPLAAAIQAAFIVGVWRSSDARLRATLIAGLLVNYLGEVLCLFVFRLYHYTAGGLPGYIVLGHGMLVWVCTVLAHQSRNHVQQRRTHLALLLTASLLMLGVVLVMRDVQSLLPFALLPLSWLVARRDEARLAVTVSFFGGLLIELYGTAVGAWIWHGSWGDWFVLGRGFANPPYGAGGFYALAELLVLLLLPALLRPVLNGRDSATLSS